MNNSDYEILLIVSPVFIFLIWYMARSIRRDSVKAKNIYYSKDYSEKNKVKILHRDERNRGVFYSSRVSEVNFNYHPASATFTAATVGGVTTGGWDYQQEHYSTSLGKTTDRYDLWYRAGNERSDDALINEIELSPEDALAAKNNRTLSQFLHGNTLILKHELVSDKISAVRATLNRTGDIYAAANMVAGDLAKMDLYKHEIDAVIDFICGK